MSGTHHYSNVVTGIASVDTSHQCLQFVLDRLFHPQVMCADQGGVCARIKDTIRFVTRSFDNEERLMLESGYPDFVPHRREHEKLLRSLTEMECTLVCGDYDNRRVFAFLTKWTNRHAAAFDKPFGNFLRAHNGDD